jgi:hypothetical protein
MRKWIVAFVVVALLAVGIYFLLAVLWGGRFVIGTVDRVVNDIVRVSGLSPWLVKGIVIMVTIPFFWAVANYSRTWWGYKPVEASLDLYLNKHGIIIVLYVAAFFLTMYFASRGSYFDTKGQRLKWCSETPEGIRVFDVEGVDPVYGVPLRPCSDDQMRALRKEAVGTQAPSPLSIADPRTFEFFDGVSGRPRVWYYRTLDGQYKLYDRPGTHPGTGAPLTPVDGTVIQQIVHLHDEHSRQIEEQRKQAAVAEAARQEQALLERYLNPGVVNQAGRTEVAIVVERGPLPANLEESIADALRKRGAEPLQSFFKPAFQGEGRARALASGDWSSVSTLKLDKHVDAVLVVGHNSFESGGC